ncbi:uncharacterized protein E0L32_006556 [Thyridium curvatum]|uniref:Uncharacterized protein n=1 Tax=Thyridium curvatum TaxID=1093900 RepID=A0A507B964_9PEZI|nr:uncharacterized protein E0L32_006556 [Thyridium curvatum]TPX13130.1 hypothetical protein E0L32_006556 [Thyridium curvatum]
MSNTPLPVPSKAAVRALRGLAFGTTCTLALVTEDRRRRINTARSAINNGEKLRSAKQYHTGGTAFAVALEEEFIVESNPIYWKRYDLPQKLQGPARRESTSKTHSAEPSPTSPTRTRSKSPQRIGRQAQHTQLPTVDPLKVAIPNIFAPTLSEPTPPIFQSAMSHQRLVSQQELKDGAARLNPDELVAQLSKLADATDLKGLNAAMRSLAVAFSMDQLPQSTLPQLFEISSRLCVAAQRYGVTEQAQEILQLAVERGPLDEQMYHAHEPFPVIKSLIPEKFPSGSAATPLTTRLQLAIALFLPKFTQPCHLPSRELFDVAGALFEAAISAKYRLGMQQICRRMIAYQRVPSDLFQTILTSLHKEQEHKLAVKLFGLLTPEDSLGDDALCQIGDAIVDSVSNVHGYRAETVLRRLFALRGENQPLRTSWVTRLLYCEWERDHNIDGIAQLFRDLFAESIALKVVHPDGVYRVMIQIYLEAGAHAKADELFHELVQLDATCETDCRLLGLFALSKAKAGDWDGVRDSFTTMRRHTAFSALDSDKIFVPILKVYKQSHTIGETEAFLKSYIDGMQVPVSRHMVAMIANEYGAVHDKTAFISWLRYCASAGFSINAAFSNSILLNCQKHWNFHYPELRSLLFRMRQLNPESEDQVTQRIMMNAAVRDAKMSANGGRCVMGKVASLGAKLSGSSASRKCNDEYDVLLTMKQAMVRGKSSRAIAAYKQAIAAGLPHNEECLRAAVVASLTGNKDDRFCVVDLMREAQDAGHDISAAAIPLLVAQLDAVDHRVGKQHSFQGLKEKLGEFEKLQLELSDFALNRAALHLCKAKHYSGAVAFALSAAERVGRRPGYNNYNFSVLMWAYGAARDVEGLAVVIAGAEEACIRDQMCYTAMKRARRLLRASSDQGAARKGLEAIAAGLERSRLGRQTLGSERQELNAVALEIMAQAAQDAAREGKQAGSVPAPWTLKKYDAERASLGSDLDEDLGFRDVHSHSDGSDIESTSVKAEPLAATG